MSTPLIRVEWYSKDNPTAQVIGYSPFSDIVDLSARKGLDIKNNILTIELKNPHAKYVNADGTIKFQEEDVVKLYMTSTNDPTDVEGTWYGNDELVGIYYIKEYSVSTASNRHRIKLSCVDKAYILFNRVFAKAYGALSTDYWTSPGIFRSVARLNSDKGGTGTPNGTDADSSIVFDLDARFVSEGGYITDYRDSPTTQLNGALNTSATTINVDSTAGFVATDGTLVIGTEHIYYAGVTGTSFTGCVRGIDATGDGAGDSHLDNATVYQGFPLVSLSKVWKPVYEWLSDLGQTENTNYPDEIDNQTFAYGRAFLLWVDKDNGIRWLPADNTVDVSLVVGTDELYEVALEKSIFDNVNMIIYNVGEDMYGAGKVWYFYDENTDIAELKMRYQPFTDITDVLLKVEYSAGADTTATYPAANATTGISRRFPTAYPVTNWTFKDAANRWRVEIENKAAWDELANDTDYNNCLADAAFWTGRIRAQAITQQLGGLRYKGTITKRGVLLNPGDLVQVTDSNTGVVLQNLRVEDVTQTFGLSQWSTNISVVEDERERGA